MQNKLVVLLTALFIIWFSTTFLIQHRLTTPADELRTILGLHSTLVNAQQEFFKIHGRYGNLRQLIGDGSGRFGVHASCQDLYCFAVEGGDSKYFIRIFPDKRLETYRLVSLYSDETLVIRVGFGLPLAHSASSVLQPETIRRLSENARRWL